jgi:2',3'-cyclic-nucleotide 2'-phosphodiesterase (5'-nucleotidase family)
LPSSEEEDKLKAELTARALSESGYDVVNVGPNDLAGGLDFLKEITKSKDFTLVSSNILSVEDLGFVFDPYVIVERGGVKVGFFGVMGGGISGAHDIETFIITDPITAGKKAVGNLAGKCDLIVGLLATDRATANEFAEEVEGVDLIITISQPSPIPVPVKVGKTTMVTADEKGKRIGRVTTNTGGARPYTFKGEMLPAGTLVLRDPVVRKVENEYYYWMKEHNPGVIVPPSGN